MTTTNDRTPLAKAIAAIPAAAAEAMQTAIPEHYTPEAAATFAVAMISSLIEAGRLTAARQRLTPEQATFADDYAFGGAMTEPVESQLSDIVSDPDPGWLVPPQWLAARAVVQDYRSQAWGRHTKVWLSYGTSTGELTVTEAREALKAMRDFLPQLEAVIEIAEESAAKDFEGDPEIARLDNEYENRKAKEAA